MTSSGVSSGGIEWLITAEGTILGSSTPIFWKLSSRATMGSLETSRQGPERKPFALSAIQEVVRVSSQWDVGLPYNFIWGAEAMDAERSWSSLSH